MLIKNLSSTSMQEITNCFNRAFADYFLKFTATEEYLENRWYAAGVDYYLSYGLFDDNRLIGFIIHCIGLLNGLKVAFNVGTGVIPEYRGKRIVKKLYDHALPILINNKIQECRLEVIQKNKKAFKAYKSVGFDIDRELICYTYNQKENHVSSNLKDDLQFKIKKTIKNIDWELLRSFWDFQPSWENSPTALTRSAERYQLVELFKKSQLIGYAIINPKNGSIPQFGIQKEERRKGYGKILFQELSKINKSLSVINVDNKSIKTKKFLNSFSFNEFISQYEMKKSLI